MELNNLYTPFISFVGDKIFIDNVKPEFIETLKKLGAVEDESEKFRLTIELHTEIEKINAFSALRDSGIPFSAGHDWSPAAQFEELRDRGLLNGKYKHIGWRGPNDYKIEEK
jgi:hypothetical protein